MSTVLQENFVNLFPARVKFVDPDTGLLTPEAYKALTRISAVINGQIVGVDDTTIDLMGLAPPTDGSQLQFQIFTDPVQMGLSLSLDDAIALELTFQPPALPVDPQMWLDVIQPSM